MAARAPVPGRTPWVQLAWFEPFDGRPHNRSEQAVRALLSAPPAGVRLEGEGLPVDFRALPGRVTRLVERARDGGAAALVLCGESRSARGLHVERVALNLIDARIPDNTGTQPIDQPVQKGAPLARLSSAPVKGLVEASRRAGTPAALSLSAGSFACNAAYFLALGKAPARLPVCFVHVPATPVLPLSRVARGLAAIARALASKRKPR